MKFSNDCLSPPRGTWSEQATKLKLKYPALTDADLHYKVGEKDEMLLNVQFKLGVTKEKLHEIIDSL